MRRCEDKTDRKDKRLSPESSEVGMGGVDITRSSGGLVKVKNLLRQS